MRYSREIEFPDCTTAEQAKDAIMRVKSVVIKPCIAPGVFTSQVDSDGYYNRYSSWIEAVDRAKHIKGVEREAGTGKLCYTRPILIVTVPDEPWDFVCRYLKRPKLRPMK